MQLTRSRPMDQPPAPDGSLAMDAASIRALGYRIVDMIAEDLGDPARRPVFPAARSREAMEAVFGGPVPRSGTEADALLTILRDHLLPAAGNPNHPRMMAYVLSASTPLTALVEALVGSIKLRPTTWKNQPASCQIEVTVARWLGDMVGFADNAAGYMTTGRLVGQPGGAGRGAGAARRLGRARRGCGGAPGAHGIRVQRGPLLHRPQRRAPRPGCREPAQDSRRRRVPCRPGRPAGVH